MSIEREGRSQNKHKMDERDDGLGLSLSLGCGRNFFGDSNCNNGDTIVSSQQRQQQQESSSLKMNLVHKPISVPNKTMQYQNHIHLHHHQASHWNDLFHLSSDHRSSVTRSFLRGIDVNQTPVPGTPAVDCDDDNGASSPNSTVSSLSGKRSERSEPVGGEETEGERDSCSRGSDDEDGGAGDNSRKKLRLTKEQALVLEETFKDHNTLNPKQKLALAKQLNLRARQVEVWFQNRRARTKLKQTEVDCEYLKRCCENLTEENRRLQKEVQELRALKFSPQLYMQMNPPTTLTMCPSCERVSSSSVPPSGGQARGVQRPVPVNPWAALPVQHRPVDASAPRS